MFSYEENYHFYDRPSMRAFEQGRYDAYAEWVGSALDLRSNSGLRVLEVGCGAGWVLDRLMQKFPGNEYLGIEPSVTACAEARNERIDVWNGTARDYHTSGIFDVVYSINVVEHTADPIAFVGTLAKLARDQGAVCIVCPNGDVVDPEILFVDHLFSFTRKNLHNLFAKAGVRPDRWVAGEGQLAQFQRLAGVAMPTAATHATVQKEGSTLLARRRHWMERWSSLDELLCERLRGYDAVLCFGAGDMSDLLRAYTPRTWSRVRGYVIDRPDGAAEPTTVRHGLPLFYLPDVDLGRWDAILLGTRLTHQANLHKRLSQMGLPVILWDDVIPCETAS
jgi:SAM-dependent methyltransferase